MAIRKCKECGKEVSSQAKQCPHCGAPQPKSVGIGGMFLVLFVGYIIYAVVGGGGSGSNTASNTTSAKARPAPTIDKSPKMQADRLKLIERLQREGIFGEISVRSSGATILVKPAFYVLDFKDKQSFVSVVYAYYFDGSDPYVPIRLKDSRTNKAVGSSPPNSAWT